MKLFFKFLVALLFCFNSSFCQSDSTDYVEGYAVPQDTGMHQIIYTNGEEIIGEILSQDEREIYVLTEDGRKIYIPQHTIKKIVPLDSSRFNEKGKFIREDKFATRYFITTNGLPIKKGEHYSLMNIYGPDFEFGLGNNFGVGVMSSWMGSPIIGTVKKSFQLGEKTRFALGGLLGTGSWLAFDWGGALPYGTFSYGTRNTNIALSGGYGAIWTEGKAEGRAITSLAGMVRLGPKLSLVFDSFILLPGQPITETYTYEEQVYNSTTGQYELVTREGTRIEEKPGFGLFIPGLRWHQGEGKAFQFGFSGLIVNGEIQPVPIPMIQWFRTL